MFILLLRSNHEKFTDGNLFTDEDLRRILEDDLTNVKNITTSDKIKFFSGNNDTNKLTNNFTNIYYLEWKILHSVFTDDTQDEIEIDHAN